MTNKITTIVNFILDSSGSMESLCDNTLSGFNEYLQSLKKREEKVLFSLTFFDTEVKRVYSLKPIKDVPKLTKKDYKPDGGTALYDAVIETVEGITDKVEEIKGKVAILNVIMTDGQENSSVKHDENCLKDLMKKLEKEGNWTFVFLGANQNSWATTSNWGMSKGNTTNWAFTSQGNEAAFKSLAQNTNYYMSSLQDTGKLSVNNFFQEGEKNATLSKS